MTQVPFGTLDATFRAAGGEPGIRQLVDRFYDIMEADPAYRELYKLHPTVNEESRDKLARFLTGWMGGPKRYQERYGSISIPAAHAHLIVTASLRDQWLSCMADALITQGYAQDLRDYLLQKLAIPADLIARSARGSSHAQP